MFVPPIPLNLSKTKKKTVCLNYKSIDSTDKGEFTRPISEAYLAIS